MLYLMGMQEATPLRRMVIQRGYRMNHIAHVAGVRPWKLSRIASGEHSAPPMFFELVAAHLRCTPDEIRPELAREEAAA